MTTKQERLKSYSLDKLRERRDAETAAYKERLYHEITYTGPMVHHLAVVEAFEWAVSEIERLQRALRDVQWVTMSSGMGSSAYPTCVGCGAKSYGSLSTQTHSPDCKIEAALHPQAEAVRDA